MAQDALLPGADTLNRVARAPVHRIRLQLDSHAPQRLEGMAQHQKLRLRVDGRALPRARDPGRSDFGAPLRPIDVHVARAADRAPAFAIDGGEWKRHAGS